MDKLNFKKNLLKNLYNNHLNLGDLYFKSEKLYNAIYHYHCALTINKNSNKLFLRILIYLFVKNKKPKESILKYLLILLKTKLSLSQFNVL